MIDFELIGRPHGVPVYFQPLVGNRVSIRLAIFVGSLDDERAGGPGTVHWFEHVPFKGTQGYPGGEDDLFGPIERHHGELNAATSFCRTVYWAVVPRKIWWPALDIVSELAGRPLLKEEAIEAERAVIYNEIAGRRSNISIWFFDEVLPRLWPGHPLGHAITGTAESLVAVQPETLRSAHQRLYDRSRAVLMISGDLDQTQVLRASGDLLAKLPDHGLSERRGPIAYQPLPPWQPGVAEYQPGFESSLAVMAWPIKPTEPDGVFKQFCLYQRLTAAFEAGSLCSPLQRLLRREKKLVYRAIADCFAPSLDGGAFFLAAVTASRKNVPEIIQSFQEVIRGDQVRADWWHEFVNDDISGKRDMEVADAAAHTDTLLNRIMADGLPPVNDEEWYQGLLGVHRDRVVEALEELTPERALVISVLGTK